MDKLKFNQFLDQVSEYTKTEKDLILSDYQWEPLPEIRYQMCLSMVRLLGYTQTKAGNLLNRCHTHFNEAARKERDGQIEIPDWMDAMAKMIKQQYE